MKGIFQNNPLEVKESTPEDLKRKRQTLLNCIGGKWYLNNIKSPKPPIKIPGWNKNKQEKIKG